MFAISVVLADLFLQFEESWLFYCKFQLLEFALELFSSSTLHVKALLHGINSNIFQTARIAFFLIFGGTLLV